MSTRMALRLHPVAPARGWAWIRDGVRLFRRRPLQFTGLFVSFMFAVLLLLLVPVVGGVLGMATLPLLTLGFMIGSRSALAGGSVNALQLVEGLRTPERARRRALLVLCGTYALGSMAVITLSDWVDGGTFEQLQVALASAGGAPTQEIDMLLADPRLAEGMLVRAGLATLMSVPFWHAPALVYWGGQGAGQALFSSTLALWRARGAFTVYALAWAGLLFSAALVVVLLIVVLGGRQMVAALSLPIGLVASAVFYVSLWFSFNDSFGADEALAEPTSP